MQSFYASITAVTRRMAEHSVVRIKIIIKTIIGSAIHNEYTHIHSI